MSESSPKDSALRVMAGIDQVPDRPRRVPPKRRRLTTQEYVAGVEACDRVVLARTLSLMENTAAAQRMQAHQVLTQLLPRTGKSMRIGISGVPGAGKSTFIEAFGMQLVEMGHRVAVLAVDPSSDVTGGSILGDKTRMERLSQHPNAFVRPSAGGGWHGGVARSTRESILVCEAAGFDIVLVETIGVGQSETMVASMVDFFLLLMLAGAGDELQGIKRGVLELADAVAINKADGDNIRTAEQARTQLAVALNLLRPSDGGWKPEVVTCSALTGMGLDRIEQLIRRHHEWMKEDGRLARKRGEQAAYWMDQTIESMLAERFRRHPDISPRLEETRRRVIEGVESPFSAAETLVNLAFGNIIEPEDEGD
jgi:LAO/AO transport system kinase